MCVVERQDVDIGQRHLLRRASHHRDRGSHRCQTLGNCARHEPASKNRDPITGPHNVGSNLGDRIVWRIPGAPGARRGQPPQQTRAAWRTARRLRSGSRRPPELLGTGLNTSRSPTIGDSRPAATRYRWMTAASSERATPELIASGPKSECTTSSRRATSPSTATSIRKHVAKTNDP